MKLDMQGPTLFMTKAEGGGALPPVTVVVPVYNEEESIESTIGQIRAALEGRAEEYEIIAVDDCSTDSTAAKLKAIEEPCLKIVTHSRNKGYGAALKTGIRAAKHSIVAITDADGTYPNEMIPALASRLGANDMVVGARTGEKASIPLIRRPAKWLIGKLANYLARYEIPDINSGLRVFYRNLAMRFIDILPDGFSFTTTITLAMLTCGSEVEYVPIDYAKRVGRSKIRPIRDTLNFVQLIIRTILLFEPLRIFLPVAFFMFAGAAGVFFYSLIFLDRLMDMTTTLLAVGALQMLAIGMLADMINKRLGR